MTPDRPHGTHSSRPVLLRPEDRKAMFLRVALQPGRPHGLRLVVCVKGDDEDPAKDPNPPALSTRQAAITAHPLRRLVQRARR